MVTVDDDRWHILHPKGGLPNDDFKVMAFREGGVSHI